MTAPGRNGSASQTGRRGRRIAFAGYYGMNNYGDDLFALCAALACRRFWPRFEPRVVGPRGYPLGTGVTASGVFGREATRGGSAAGKLARGLELAFAAARAERVVFAGGSIFHSGRLAAASLLLNPAARRLGFAAAAVGVSVGPFPRAADRAAVHRQLATLEFLAVRDRCSAEMVRALDPTLPLVETADLAGVFPDFIGSTGSSRGERLSIGFAPCFDGSGAGADGRLCRAFAGALTPLSRKTQREIDVTVFCLNTHPAIGDAALAADAARLVREHGHRATMVRYDELGVEETWRRIGRTDIFVSGRLHGAITAYLQGVPFLLHEYHRKCSDWLADVGGAGTMGIGAAEVSGEAVAERLHDLLGRNGALLPVPDYRARARRNFTAAPWCA